MDELKKWEKEQRKEIDSFYETDLDSLWDQIDQGLDKDTRTIKWYSKNWVRIAAAILLLMVVGVFLVSPGGESQKNYSLGDLSPELADTEFYYTSQLGEKLEIIKASGVDIDPQVFEDLDQLNSVYNELMKDLQDNADNEEVVQAMIENYRIRLQILEQILNEIQGDDKEESDEISI